MHSYVCIIIKKNIFNFSELLGEAIFGLCQAEEKGLQEILQSWLDLKPTMEKLKIQ